jgi:hypothetical protein
VLRNLEEMDVDTLRDLLVIAAGKIEGSRLCFTDEMKVDVRYQFAIRQLHLIASCVMELMERIEENESHVERQGFKREG